MSEQNEDSSVSSNYPLWKPALAKLRERKDYGYGLKLPVDYFEQSLSRKRDDTLFSFEMLQLKQAIENEDGYYLRCRTEMDDETGYRVETWQIPSAAEHEEVAKMFEGKLSSYAKRAVDIRNRTLENESAVMSAEERRQMESSVEHAAIRAVLLRRQKSITDCVRKHAERLLK